MKVSLKLQNLETKDSNWGVDFIDLRKSYISKDAGKDVLSVVYCKDSNSKGDNMNNGGAEIDFAPTGVLPSVTKATFGCKIKYPSNFDFTRGGKTGVGFAMGDGNASGGRRSDNASSARIMWRQNGAATLYIYTPKNLHQLDENLDNAAFSSGDWGVEFFKDVFKEGTLKRGMWNDVAIQVGLNTFDAVGNSNPDGFAIMTINGVSASIGGIRWLKRKDSIRYCPFNTFFGGEEWAATKDELVLYKDFWVSN